VYDALNVLIALGVIKK